METLPKILQQRKRIVIKIGSGLLVEQNRLQSQWLDQFSAELAALKRHNIDVAVISSGAVALGENQIARARSDWRLEQKQAAAAIGQIALAHHWHLAFARHHLIPAQILLTLQDTEQRTRHLNARATIRALFKEQAIPVINENDTVATTQIRYGDNDRLAARLATMISADLLILLSDVDGLYTADPTFDPDASHLPCIRHITPEIERLAGASTSPYASGGMATKIDAARIAIQGGCAMLVADGRKALPLSRLATDRFTIFEASLAPQPARKRWIAGSLNVTGYLRLDDGAIKALRAGKSLLAAGIAGSSGQFERGDHVRLETLSGMRFAVAITSYSSDEIARIRGQQSRDIARILGYDRGPAIIHRDDLALDEPSDSS